MTGEGDSLLKSVEKGRAGWRVCGRLWLSSFPVPLV